MAYYARNRMFFASSTSLMLASASWMSLSLIWHDPVPIAWRVPLTLALIVFSQCITSMRVLITKRPDLPFALVRTGGFISAAFVTLFWLVLLRDALLGLALALGLLPAMSEFCGAAARALLSIPVELGMLGASFLIAALGMAFALRVPPVREVRIAMPNLPPELEGLRIAQLSDLHIGSTFGGDWLQKVVDRTNALAPDFTFITGDLADGTPSRIGHHLQPLTDLRARYGVLASPGNHDYYSGLVPWLETWRGWGLTMLLNDHRDFEVKGRTVRVAGVTDPCAKLFPSLGPKMGPPDTKLALRTPSKTDGASLKLPANSAASVAPDAVSCRITSGVDSTARPESGRQSVPGSDAAPHASLHAAAPIDAPIPAPADFTILLAHRPGHARPNAALGVDLQLSGHTHGGQFFFLFPLVARMNRGFRSGLYHADNMPLYVSPGTGMWGYVPMRFGSRSEISLLVLTEAPTL